MSRVIDPVGRNWRTEEKADYSTLSTCRCEGGTTAYAQGLRGIDGSHCKCGSGNSQAKLHCDAGI